MKLIKTRHIAILMLLALLVSAAGCSTQKNTAKTRFWHAFKARYNTYYNGTLAYIDGSLEKEQGNKDNFTELIPLYTVGNKQSREIGKNNFERSIEKCQKTIKLHSIKRRPVWEKKRRKTLKDIEWLSRREYNPFLWRAWLLMGRSQFYKGAFDEAASTFAYMSRLYKTQPAIYCKARAWLAKSYIEEGWLYDAEDVIRGMRRDSMHWAARKEWDYTYADYYIHTGEYDKAIPYLRQVIKHEMRRKQRAREWFLMGQLQRKLGNNREAMKAFGRVVSQNPPYEVEFNARIAMTEVMLAGQSKKMIGRLKRMAASDKNKDYLDQVYYAIGNIHMARKDTASAISAYERGAAKATRSGIEKGVLLLRLGDVYWSMERYNDAQRCYGEAIGLLDKDRKDYEQLANRSKVLDELVPHTDAIHLQDSLQALSLMSEADRNAAIDRTIDALKKKEKAERDKEAEKQAQETIQKNGGTQNATNRPGANSTQQQGQSGVWYFYNPLAVSQGKTAFQKQWGKRENVDNWQRVNKTVVAFADAEAELTDEQRDSVARAEALADSLAQVTDSAQNDPHKREYYMAQIPFTAEQKAESNKIIEEALFNAGVIFKDKLDNLALSEKELVRLVDSYPEYSRMADAYYHLYLLYMRRHEPERADGYVQRLKKEYPDNEWTTLLTDPYFVENAKFGVHVEDSIYAATYDAFKAGKYSDVMAGVKISDTRFPLGANRDKFIFIGGLGKLNEGDADGCLADMNTVVKKFPQSGVSQMAGMIVKGVGEGRRLRGGKFDLGNVWERRSEVLRDSDSTAVRTLSADRNAPFVYMIVYRPDSVDENRMLFELARYNFTSYLVRNFDIAVEDADGLHRMVVRGFRNYDEALQYARQLYAQKPVAALIGRSRTVVVSETNLPLLGRQFSYDDYARFYAEHFAPLRISSELLLNEPDIVAPSPDDTPSGNGRAADEPSDDFDAPSGTLTVPDEPNTAEPDSGNSEYIPDERPGTPASEQPGTTVVPDEQPAVQPQPKPQQPQPTQPKVQPTQPKVQPTQPKAQPVEQPKQPSKPADEPKQPSKNLEDEFYFGDTPQPAQPKSSNSGVSTDYDDDEYYDLDGF